MFTLNIYLKLAIIAVCFIGGTILAFMFGFWYAFPFFLVGLLLLVSYVMLGTVQSAAKLIETNDLDAAQNRLKLTLSPKLLYVTNRAYYYIMKGSIAIQQKDEKKAEEWFKIAQDLKLPSDNERAMIKLQLAGIYAKKNNWNKVKSIMRGVKDYNVTEPNLKMQIDQILQAVKQRGAINPSNMRQAQQMGRSKKQRRPRMR